AVIVEQHREFPAGLRNRRVEHGVRRDVEHRLELSGIGELVRVPDVLRGRCAGRYVRGIPDLHHHVALVGGIPREQLGTGGVDPVVVARADGVGTGGFGEWRLGNDDTLSQLRASLRGGQCRGDDSQGDATHDSVLQGKARMKRQLLFVQGGGAGTHDEWDDKLVASLRRELGPTVEIRYPRMPNEDDPKYKVWKAALEKELATLDDGAILIGHSIGATIMINALAE